MIHSWIEDKAHRLRNPKAFAVWLLPHAANFAGSFEDALRAYLKFLGVTEFIFDPDGQITLKAGVQSTTFDVPEWMDRATDTCGSAEFEADVFLPWVIENSVWPS